MSADDDKFGSSILPEVAIADLDQVKRLLSEIAINASHISALSRQSYDAAPDASAVDVLVSAINVLACRVGWMADVASIKAGGRASISEAAADWLLP